MANKQNQQFNFRVSDEIMFKLGALAKANDCGKAKVIRDLINKAYDELI